VSNCNGDPVDCVPYIRKKQFANRIRQPEA
jgi:hypothetical protein